MALMRAYAFLVLLLLAGWASGLVAATALASGQQPRPGQDVYPLALRYSRQLRDQIALPPLARGKPSPRAEKLVPAVARPDPGPGRWRSARLRLCILMSFRC